MTRPEEILQEKVAKYLVCNYPNILFHSDYGSGAKLGKGQAAKQKRQNGGRRAWPDMFIAQPSTDGEMKFDPHPRPINDDGIALSMVVTLPRVYAGLFLELKKEGEALFPGPRAQKRFRSKDGLEYRTQHFMEQADVLYALRQRGYYAVFAIGFEEAISYITAYLGEPPKQEIEF